ncbi:MAG: L,D-transpeptidase catalytic domain [Sphingomonadales bacterium]|jgi:peptidoglycan hydrolase-like protein with peptidoglycan-binding domain|nr:L,D-transpeptidase catalytic domain [Sphingomonadales bacterium]
MAKSIHVDLENFVVSVREDGVEVRRIDDCSFGRHDGDPSDLTPTPFDSVLPLNNRHVHYRNDQNSPMPFSLFFDEPHDGCAFHWGNTFVESHGCVHLSREDAEWLYRWAGGPPFSDPQPVALRIRGQHPLSGTRVYKRDTATGMGPSVILKINTVLHAAGHLAREPDANFDAGTEAAVMAFQRAQHFDEADVDGKVGLQTAMAMKIASDPELPIP